MTRLIAALGGLLFAFTAGAVPMTMTHSGRLMDPAGGAVEGAHDLTVRLTDGAGLERWADTFTDVPLQNGYFALVLGSGSPLQASDLAADTIHISVTVDDGPVLSTTPMSSVPFAIRTEETRNLRGGTVSATTISGESASISGALSADSAQITGLVESNGILTDSVSTNTLGAEAMSAASLNVDGPVTAQALESSGDVLGVNFVGEHISVDTANVSSQVTAGTIESGDIVSSGNVFAEDISADTLTVSTELTAGSIEAGDALLTGTVLAGNVSADSLEVTGDTVLADVLSDSLLTSSLGVDGDITATTLTVDSIEAGQILVDGQDFDGPVVGEWYPSTHRNSASGNYELMTFDSQRFNTDSNEEYYRWDGSRTITFTKAGYYRVDVRGISHNNGHGNHFETWKNGSRLHLSHSMYASGTSWRRHATSVVSYFNVGDTLQVRVYCATSTQTYCYHQGPDYTALTVQYMR